MDVQHFERLLVRYERLAGLSPRLKWLEKECDHLRSTLSIAQAANRRHERDMQAATAKIEEWAAYATDLRERVNWRRQSDIPVRPARLETEIPF